MDIKFLSAAEDELAEAVVFYNLESEGLGFEFAAEVKRTLAKIIQYPEAWPKLSLRVRRCRTNRFPYGVIYQARDDILLIVAVMHLSRDPKTWKARLENEKA
ncbi:MAG: type II toxin-antitoxin system RelE/ParE family toxin [Actinomycetota bacterium]|nr:type II toxin-antitoxin system RelE/ParE family toxin [Actinomycetota bacterium]